MSGKIIKSGDGTGSIEPVSLPRVPVAPRRAVVDAEEYEAHTRAREIVDRAEAQATQIRARAQQEREQVLEAARQEGHQEGLAEMTEILARTRLEAGAQLEALEPQVVKLAIKAAERIIGSELVASDETILKIVAKAIEQLRQSKELVLRLHPDDLELLRAGKRQLLEYVGRIKDIGFREDAAVARGGCIIETEHGTVDAQLATQLELLERALLGDPK